MKIECRIYIRIFPKNYADPDPKTKISTIVRTSDQGMRARSRRKTQAASSLLVSKDLAFSLNSRSTRKIAILLPFSSSFPEIYKK
jgi:hypothetical protein